MALQGYRSHALCQSLLQPTSLSLFTALSIKAYKAWGKYSKITEDNQSVSRLQTHVSLAPPLQSILPVKSRKTFFILATIFIATTSIKGAWPWLIETLVSIF